MSGISLVFKNERKILEVKEVCYFLIEIIRKLVDIGRFVCGNDCDHHQGSLIMMIMMTR